MTVDLTRVVVLRWEEWSESRCFEGKAHRVADGWGERGEERGRERGQLTGVWPETLTGQRSLLLRQERLWFGKAGAGGTDTSSVWDILSLCPHARQSGKGDRTSANPLHNVDSTAIVPSARKQDWAR